jgi:hypothetical protein
MLALYLATSLAVWLLFRLVAGIIDKVKLKDFDRQVGALIGVAKGVLLCLVITFFARGTNSQFSGAGAGVMAGAPGQAPASDLYIVDIATSTATLLARAMGMATPQDTGGYVPFGAEDLHKHYYPTVSPVAAGGFYWVFFDSIRHYGNQGLVRQLWGSALSIAADRSYVGDPSHPAFYVTGQDLATGNHRAFTALDPCRQDGESCETGIDCCSGFCTNGICGVPEQPRCSNTNEACETTADCCNPADLCLGGFCGQIVPE